jgi:hypothetical protein
MEVMLKKLNRHTLVTPGYGQAKVPPSRKTRDEGQLLRIYSSSIYHSTLPRIPNHLLHSLLCFTTPGRMYHSKKFTQGGTLDSSTQVSPTHHILGVVDYKALTGLSLLWVPHFFARCGASLKVIHLDTTSVSITKCFLVS